LDQYLIKTFNLEIRQQKSKFHSVPNRIPKMMTLLDEIDSIQYEAIEKEAVTVDKVDVYKNDLEVLYFVLLDFESNIDSVNEWYETFTGEIPDNLVEKMDKRIEKNY